MNYRKKIKNHDASFTLIELLVVMLIITILAGFTIGISKFAADKAKKKPTGDIPYKNKERTGRIQSNLWRVSNTGRPEPLFNKLFARDKFCPGRR
jgi:prepilin-type N-terminal cleavage/methylation domain-containing protein